MEVDILGESNSDNTGIKENGFQLFPVSVNDSGEGLPYAPVNFPNPGDKWLWKVGKRISASGYFMDRYLYLPSCLQISRRKRKGFKSKLSVQEYIQKTFPSSDVDAFFASFSWKIPSEGGIKGCEEELGKVLSSEEITKQSPESEFDGELCKAKNKLCSSLLEPQTHSLEHMPCDICCSERGFCRDCCCLLCNKTVSYAYGGYNFIDCHAAMGEGTICGHIAHIDCALRCYMAGTVGGTIGLDAEYYCRRCDSITDFIPHVAKILQTCETIESREEVEKVLNVGRSVLSGSQKTSAKNLLSRIELAMTKLKDGVCPVDLWKMEGISFTTERLSGHVNDESETENYQDSIAFGVGSPQVLAGSINLLSEALKFEDEIDQILFSLRNAQRSEYRIADDSLHAQKNCILNLYRQLQHERLQLSAQTSSENSEALLEAVREREEQIKNEIQKVRDMKQVAKGFGMTSKDVLEEYFGLNIHP